jgi:hypothetical protein
VVEELDVSSGNAVVFAFQSDTDDRDLVVYPTGLRPDATYGVTSVDAGVLGSASGKELMVSGVALVPGASRGHIVVLRVQ